MKNKVLHIIVLLLTCGFLYSQNLEVSTLVETEAGRGISTAVADIYVGNVKKQSVYSDSRGIVSFELEYGKNYKVVISKSGMIQKRIDFNTNIPEEEVRKITTEFSVFLTEDCAGANTAVFEEPMDVVRFDEGFGAFMSDQSHLDKMQSRAQSAYRSIQKCKEDTYEEKKQEADKAFKEGDFTKAEELYEEALKVYPNDSYAKRQISQSKKGNQKQQLNSAKYDKLLKEGEQFLAQGQLSAAQARFNEASRLNPSESAAKAKITEIEQILAQKSQQMQQEKALNDEYNGVIGKANNAMASKNYALAKELYEQASKIKPNEAFPGQKLAMAQQALAKEEQNILEQEKVEKLYQKALAMGQTALQNENYTEAEKHYLKASSFKPKESLPKQQIQKVQSLQKQKELEQLKAQREELERNYAETIQKGEGLMVQKEFDASIEAFKQALQYKPSDKYAQAQIGKAKNLKVKEEQDKQVEIENAYLAAMQKGDAQKSEKQFTEAILAYESALQAKPSDPAAQSKLTESKKLLADQQRRFKEETEQKAKYKQFIQEADSYFNSQDYSNAKAKFQEALSLYPSETYPKNKIAAIDNINAKNQKQSEYDDLITQADQHFNQQNFDQAIASYSRAKLVLPQETYPQEKINEISKIRTQQASDEKQAEYDQLASSAEQKIEEENFEEAKSLYAQAMRIVPENPYPQQRINEINTMISTTAKNAIQDKYNSLVAEAENAVNQENFELAKSVYLRASAVVPENPYPNQRINEINELIQNKAKSALEQEYNALAAQAEQQILNENYEKAKTVYASASRLMPENPYPQQRINEINAMISNQSVKKEQEEFDALLAQAEVMVKSEEFGKAKGLLGRAALILPEDPFPQIRINEINGLIDQKAKAQKAGRYNELIGEADALFDQKSYIKAKEAYGIAQKENAEADYPRQKINEINQLLTQLSRDKKESEYIDEITKADNLFETQQYEQAISLYMNASRIIPEKTYPRQKINEINSLIADKSRTEREAKELQQQYDNTIALADKFLAEDNYSLSKAEYRKALSLKSQEQYPKNQITKIDGLIAEEAQQRANKKELDRKFSEAIATGDRLFKEKQYIESKKYYNAALAIRTSDAHSTSQIKRIDKLVADDLAAKNRLAEIDAKYAKIVSTADARLSSKDYKNAKALYYSALEVKPNEAYPRQQLKKIDETLKSLVVVAAKTKTNVVSTSSATSTVKTGGSSGKLQSLSFKNNSERLKYKEELLKKYKSGITQETYVEGKKTTKRYIVIRGGQVFEARAIIFTWGGAEYSIDGKPTNSMHFKSQIKAKAGETVNKVKL